MHLIISDLDPTICAATLDDLSVSRAVTDAKRTLCHAVSYYGGMEATESGMQTDRVFRWVRRDRLHYMWTLDYLDALLIESASRLGEGHSVADVELAGRLRGLIGYVPVVVWDPDLPLVYTMPDCEPRFAGHRYANWTELIVGGLGVNVYCRPWYWVNSSGRISHADLAVRGLVETATEGRVRLGAGYTLFPAGLYRKYMAERWAAAKRVRLYGSWISSMEMLDHASNIWFGKETTDGNT